MLKVIVSTEATEYARNTDNTTEQEFDSLKDWCEYVTDVCTNNLDIEILNFRLYDDGSAGWDEVRDCECVEEFHEGGHLLPVSAWVDGEPSVGENADCCSCGCCCDGFGTA